MGIDPKLIDQLLVEHGHRPEDIAGENGLLKQLTKALLERAMDAELTDHLGYEKHDPAGYNNKALVYKRLNQYQKEESLYRVALSLAPNDVTAMNNLGVNLAHQGRHEEANGVLERGTRDWLIPGSRATELRFLHALANDPDRARQRRGPACRAP